MRLEVVAAARGGDVTIAFAGAGNNTPQVRVRG